MTTPSNGNGHHKPPRPPKKPPSPPPVDHGPEPDPDEEQPPKKRTRGAKGNSFNGKPTKAQMNSLISFAMILIARYSTTREIIFLLKQQSQRMFANTVEPGVATKPISKRSCMNYIARARKRIAELTGLTPTQQRDKSQAFWLTIVRDHTASLKDRMFAQQQLDGQNGLMAPLKFANTTPDGQSVPQQATSLTINLLQSEQGREVLAQLTELGAGFKAPKSLEMMEPDAEIKPKEQP